MLHIPPILLLLFTVMTTTGDETAPLTICCHSGPNTPTAPCRPQALPFSDLPSGQNTKFNQQERYSSLFPTLDRIYSASFRRVGVMSVTICAPYNLRSLPATADSKRAGIAQSV